METRSEIIIESKKLFDIKLFDEIKVEGKDYVLKEIYVNELYIVRYTFLEKRLFDMKIRTDNNLKHGEFRLENGQI